jgi:L-ascorbate metabolism protein UlaG (beta-lactamase superfamily)
MAGTVTWWGHSTAVVELGGQRALVDPLLRSGVGPLRWAGRAPGAEPAARASVVLISHPHRDHLDLPSVAMVAGNVPVVVPRGTGRLLRGRRPGPVRELAAGEELRLGELTIRAVPAEHDGRRWPVGAGMPALGYLLTAAEGSVFHAGDTGPRPGLDDLRAERVGLALLPIGGWGPTLGPGHLDPGQAARALTQFAPRRVIPVHWGDLRLAGLWRLWPVERRRDFVEAAARLAPDVDVVLPRPGEPVAVPGGEPSNPVL